MKKDERYCKVEECWNIKYANGLCQKHYMRAYRESGVERNNRKNKGYRCVECEKNPAVAQGLCRKCYNHLYYEQNKDKYLKNVGMFN